jgi:GxxExxY protein
LRGDAQRVWGLRRNRRHLISLRAFASFAPLRYPLINSTDLTHRIIGAAINIHRALGPRLLKAVYEECLAREFVLRGIPFERQKPIPLVYKDLKLECDYRLDFLIDQRVVLELTSIESIAPIHESVMLTYPRLSGCHLGLLIKFQCRDFEGWHWTVRVALQRRRKR